jgi:pyruvate dehydrogenase E1 component alpha subunit
MRLLGATRRFHGGNAIAAGGLPLAVGLALADRLQGGERVTACLFGDGAVAEGESHESMNLAALWHLPVLCGEDIALISYGGTLAKILMAADELERRGVRAEVVDLRTLCPPDTGMVVASVRRAHRAVVVDEGWGSVGISAEVAARIAEEATFDPDRLLVAEGKEVPVGRPLAAITSTAASSGPTPEVPQTTPPLVPPEPAAAPGPAPGGPARDGGGHGRRPASGRPCASGPPP